ncbi:hypothetical protein NPIL_181401 [Nephila pilipes]|uniref:Uncharacterized protein n=1 Tax=Nephila pilipes TaxID=299642 RepID=A0A8X6PVL2_NEPPI|nr:hypothetical protein NPIL_181401 [Nephila pilipes]
MALICGPPKSLLDIGIGVVRQRKRVALSRKGSSGHTGRTASRWYRRSFVKGRSAINQTPVADCDLLGVSLGIFQKLHYCHRPPLILLGKVLRTHSSLPRVPLGSFRILTDLPSSPGDGWEGLLGFKVLRFTNEHDAVNWRKDRFRGDCSLEEGAFEDPNGQRHD